MGDYRDLVEIGALPDMDCSVVAWLDEARKVTTNADAVDAYVLEDLASGERFIVPKILMDANEETGHAKRIAPN